MSKIVYHYYGDRSLARANIITVATTRDGDKLICGFSFANKKDLYDKKFGCKQAAHRMKWKPVVIEWDGNTSSHAIISRFLKDSNIGPTWVPDAVVSDEIRRMVKSDLWRQMSNQHLAEHQKFAFSVGQHYDDINRAFMYPRIEPISNITSHIHNDTLSEYDDVIAQKCNSSIVRLFKRFWYC